MTSLFDHLATSGSRGVRALVGRHETLELDFKQRARPKEGGEKHDKRVLAKALSAFSNSMGGLIVWGVDCRKNADGVDEVVGFVPVVGLAKFASDVREWAIEATMPRLADVRVETLDEGGDAGFLLIAVSRSERRPHRCEIGDKLYYRRAGASSRPMEHFEIEDAFRRVSIPELKVEYRITEGGGMQSGAKASTFITILISLRNVSTVSARNAYVSTHSRAIDHHSGMIGPAAVSVREQPPLLFYELEGGIIHPGVSRLVAPLQRYVEMWPLDGTWQLARTGLAAACAPFVVGFGCLNAPMRTVTIEPTEAEILANIRPAPVVV